VNTTALPDLLSQSALGWSDMPAVFAAINTTAEKTPRKFKVFQRLKQMFGWFGRANAHEAAVARKKLDAFLVKHKLTWSEVTAILAASAAPTVAPPSPASTDEPRVNVLALVLRLLEKYVWTTEAQRMVAALWTLFTWVCFQYFSIAPRLAILSPVDT